MNYRLNTDQLLRIGIVPDEVLESANRILEVQTELEKEKLYIQLKWLKRDLDKFFAENLVSDRKIEKYKINLKSEGCIQLEPVEPYFEESYEDDVADEKIQKIGETRGFKRVDWALYVYHN
jgi:hypothetical protein